MNPDAPVMKVWQSCGALKMSYEVIDLSLCSRNFQNVKLRLDFVEIWSFYHHSDFTWNPILVNSNCPEMSLLAILDSGGSAFWFLVNLSNFQVPKYHNSKFRVSKIAKNDIFETFELAKIWFHVKSEWWR